VDSNRIGSEEGSGLIDGFGRITIRLDSDETSLLACSVIN
jgi:hypothetical protein